MEISLDSVGRAFLYLGIPSVLMVFYLQWRWARVCKNNIQVLVVQLGGGGSFELAPKTGGEVSIKNPTTGTSRTWPINELSTIDVLYPGVGFVPAFLQKTIRMAIVNEGDWEPLLNRSPHMLKVASPDLVTEFLRIAGDADEKTCKKITELLKNVSTSPTREMIANPAVLDNLIHEGVTKLAVTVVKDIIDPINEAVKRMGQKMNPLIVYIGLGLIVILLGFVIYKLMPILAGMEDMANGVALIKQSLGVK